MSVQTNLNADVGHYEADGTVLAQTRMLYEWLQGTELLAMMKPYRAANGMIKTGSDDDFTTVPSSPTRPPLTGSTSASSGRATTPSEGILQIKRPERELPRLCQHHAYYAHGADHGTFHTNENPQGDQHGVFYPFYTVRRRSPVKPSLKVSRTSSSPAQQQDQRQQFCCVAAARWQRFAPRRIKEQSTQPMHRRSIAPGINTPNRRNSGVRKKA